MNTFDNAGNGVRNNPKKFISSWRRLKHDYLMIMKDPIPYISVAPRESDILEWHYVIRGPEDSIYKGGYYHGKLRFPADYPFKPPSIYMITPSGRFKTNTRLCLSFSDFHPDTWNPTWSLSTILTGLLSFMLEEHNSVGSMQTSDTLRRVYAKKSLKFNVTNPIFVELFPDIANEIKNKLEGIRVAQNSPENSIQQQTNRENKGPDYNHIWSYICNAFALGFVIIIAYIMKCVLSDGSIISGTNEKSI